MYYLKRDKRSKSTLLTSSIIAILLVASQSITNVNASLGLSNLEDVDNIGQSVKCVIVVNGCNGIGSVDSSGDTIIGSNNNTEEPELSATLIVNKIVTCIANATHVGCEDMDSNFEPRDFIITVTGHNPNPSQFGGSSSGTEVTLEPGSYDVTEDVRGVDRKVVTTDDNGNIIQATTIYIYGEITFSEHCSGTIEAGETRTCTITNPILIQ